MKEIALRNFLYCCLAILLIVTVAGRLYHPGLLSLLFTVSLNLGLRKLANRVAFGLNRG